ncbi:MAG: response regulator [Paenibacillaceae bacterium]|nr:response regulator [Paenibacillaceae bacterium]
MIRAIMIDDEAMALVALELALRQIEPGAAIDVLGKYRKVADAIGQTAGQKVDLIFLDIEMPGISGLDAVEPLLAVHPQAEIIFVTAYQQHAIDAFELNAMDYLLKPVAGERLRKSIDRFLARHRKAEADARSTAETADRDGNTRTEPTDERLRLDVLGGLALYDRRGDLVSWRTKRAKELFAYLWHHRGAPVLRNRMLDELWPETPLDRALAHFHTTVYQVRGMLKQLGCPDSIAFADERYRLRSDCFICDEPRLAEKLKSKRFDPETLSLYGGDYLEADYYEWAAPRRNELHSDMVHYLKRWAGLTEGEAAVSIWRKLIALDPYEESFYTGLMRLLGEAGQRKAVDEVYAELQRVLRGELGASPSAEAENLAKRYGY